MDRSNCLALLHTGTSEVITSMTCVIRKNVSLTFIVGECGSFTGSIAVGSSDPYVLSHTVWQSKCGFIYF